MVSQVEHHTSLLSVPATQANMEFMEQLMSMYFSAILHSALMFSSLYNFSINSIQRTT